LPERKAKLEYHSRTRCAFTIVRGHRSGVVSRFFHRAEPIVSTENYRIISCSLSPRRHYRIRWSFVAASLRTRRREPRRMIMRPRGVTTLEFADFISSFFVTAAGIMGENLHFSFAGNAVYLRTGQLRSRFFVAIFNRRARGEE